MFALTVNVALLTVSVPDVYKRQAVNPVFTASYGGFVNGDTTSVLSGNPNLTTSATTNSPAGNYTITNTVGTLSTANYLSLIHI